MRKLALLFLTHLSVPLLFGQSSIIVYPDSILQDLNKTYEYGTFYVPKTTEAQADFLNNGDHLNTIRLHIVESALNNSTDLNTTLSYLDDVSSIIQEISDKTDKVIFIIEKMPAWLSSSNDGSPAQTPGWFVLNTKPPASYVEWNNMVQEVSDRIINTYGISNAYFEIWNEPDLGSWTGTESEYFELFRETYDAIKSIDNTIPVGGPATNHWANNINYTAPFGYISNTDGQQSLIAQLIDSTIFWNKPLDFVSWHNFNLSIETHQNAIDFISEKYSALSSALPELFVSEWNAPSAVRDSDLHYAFAVKNTVSIKNSSIASDVIAAWQDFEFSTNEFHADYGLLSYGSIRKPFFNAVKLASELRGNQIVSTSNVPLAYDASITNDTLNILVSNYTPPPIIEALNQTLFQGQFNVNDLENAGYININTNDLSNLESIYMGVNSISNTSLLNEAINNAIPTYTLLDSLQDIIHHIEININGYSNSYSGMLYMVDDSTNNDQFSYESLINSGATQASAISQIQGNQAITNEAISINEGMFSLAMKPNSVALIKIIIPGINAVQNIDRPNTLLNIFPNPAQDILRLEHGLNKLGEIRIVDENGRVIKEYTFNSKKAEISIESLAVGFYFIQTSEGELLKFIKQ